MVAGWEASAIIVPRHFDTPTSREHVWSQVVRRPKPRAVQLSGTVKSCVTVVVTAALDLSTLLECAPGARGASWRIRCCAGRVRIWAQLCCLQLKVRHEVVLQIMRIDQVLDDFHVHGISVQPSSVRDNSCISYKPSSHAYQF